MAPGILTSDVPEEHSSWKSADQSSQNVTFDPSKHMAFEAPEAIITLKELLLSEENACSPVAITKPFPLFSLDGVTEMRRDIFRKDVVQKHGQKIKPGVYKMRGYSQDTPFVDAVWRSPEVIEACSRAAGVDLEVIFDYEIGHVNVQLDALADKTNLYEVLPPAVPKNEATSIPADSKSTDEQLESVRDWHIDAYPWVCVCMLSDPEGMIGGETGLQKGDGSVVKMLGPGIGWAVMMQGGCINHIALRAYGCSERITMVTSFKAKDPLAKDMSTLNITNKSSRLEELFLQWTTYRMDVVSKRAAAMKEEIGSGQLSAETIKKKMDDWVREQTSYLEVTCREMHDAVPYALRPGVYVATLTFFFVGDDETLDTQTLRTHISRLCKSGISGIVTLGSNGEAVHLSPEERQQVIVTTREVLDLERHTDMPVLVGCSAESTQQTIALCRDAAQAGGSHALVLPPSYYKAAMTPETILAFYHAVADASPLPLIVYSFPPVVNGLDMSSDLIIQISQHPNVVGTKFTCGDTGKLARVARAMNTSRTSTSPTPTPTAGGGQYWAFGGLADFTLQALVAGGAGVIAGGAKLAPKAVVKVYESFKQGKLKEAMELQALLAEGDWVHTVAGIGGTKAVLQHHFSYGGVPRLPLTGPSVYTIDGLMQGTSELMELEKAL
ncbi:hypothetical protein LTR92_008348 [Exophiala xenobiotica]|nr:hypothetical protein LTR92_008348 [Exophiala xenobiotica]